MYEKFAELLDKTNKTAYQVSKDTGIGQNIFSNWKAGRSNPKADKLKILADYFGVSIEYFLEYVIDWLNNCFEFCGESKIVVNVGKDTNVPSNDGWIPVEERLPEDCKEIVLVQVSGKPADNILFDNAFEFALYEKEEGWMLDNYPEWKNPDVIAWQPLPEPYRRFKKELS